MCGYRLPWGYNVLALYLKDAAAAEDEWPAACDYYSAFAKYGVHQLVACWLLTFGVAFGRWRCERRRRSTRHKDPDELLKWLQRGGLATLGERGLDEGTSR